MVNRIKRWLLAKLGGIPIDMLDVEDLNRIINKRFNAILDHQFLSFGTKSAMPYEWHNLHDIVDAMSKPYDLPADYREVHGKFKVAGDDWTVTHLIKRT